MNDAIAIAAIAAVAPTGAVILAWNQQRAAMRRVEENTNGQITALKAQIDGLRRLRAADLTARSSARREQPPRAYGALDTDEPPDSPGTGSQGDDVHRR